MKKENAITFVHMDEDKYLSYDSLKYIMLFVLWFFTILVGVFVVISNNIPNIVLLAVINLLYLGIIVVLRFKLLRNTYSLRFMTNGISYLLLSVFWLVIACSMLMLLGYDNVSIILYGILVLYIIVISIYLLSVIIMLNRVDKLKIDSRFHAIYKIACVCILCIVIVLMLILNYCSQATDAQVGIYVTFCIFFLIALLYGCGLTNFIKYYFCMKYDIKNSETGDRESVLLIPASNLKK